MPGVTKKERLGSMVEPLEVGREVGPSLNPVEEFIPATMGDIKIVIKFDELT